MANANYYFRDSLCYVVIGERAGIINPNGEFVADINNKEINWVYRYRDGVAICISTDGRYGLINKHGSFVLPTIYKNIKIENNHSTGHLPL